MPEDVSSIAHLIQSLEQTIPRSGAHAPYDLDNEEQQKAFRQAIRIGIKRLMKEAPNSELTQTVLGIIKHIENVYKRREEQEFVRFFIMYVNFNGIVPGKIFNQLSPKLKHMTEDKVLTNPLFYYKLFMENLRSLQKGKTLPKKEQEELQLIIKLFKLLYKKNLDPNSFSVIQDAEIDAFLAALPVSFSVAQYFPEYVKYCDEYRAYSIQQQRLAYAGL